MWAVLMRFSRRRCFSPSRIVSKKIPLLCTISPYLYEREREGFFILFSTVMMILPVIITFSFCDGFFLSSIMLSLHWDESPDFWHEVNGWCHYSCKVFSFWHCVDWDCTLPSCVLLQSSSDLLSGKGTFTYYKWGSTQTSRSLLARYLWSSLNAASLHLANISMPKVGLYWLGYVVWRGLSGW